MATSAQREWAGREVKEPRSQACWLGAAFGELGGPWSHLEAPSELCLDGEATHSGRWKGLGEADTEVNLPAVLCKTPLSMHCSCNKTRDSYSHGSVPSSLHPRDAGPRDRRGFHTITQTFHCGCPGEQRRVLPGMLDMSEQKWPCHGVVGAMMSHPAMQNHWLPTQGLE